MSPEFHEFKWLQNLRLMTSDFDSEKIRLFRRCQKLPNLENFKDCRFWSSELQIITLESSKASEFKSESASETSGSGFLNHETKCLDDVIFHGLSLSDNKTYLDWIQRQKYYSGSWRDWREFENRKKRIRGSKEVNILNHRKERFWRFWRQGNSNFRFWSFEESCEAYRSFKRVQGSEHQKFEVSVIWKFQEVFRSLQKPSEEFRVLQSLELRLGFSRIY